VRERRTGSLGRIAIFPGAGNCQIWQVGKIGMQTRINSKPYVGLDFGG